MNLLFRLTNGALTFATYLTGLFLLAASVVLQLVNVVLDWRMSHG